MLDGSETWPHWAHLSGRGQTRVVQSLVGAEGWVENRAAIEGSGRDESSKGLCLLDLQVPLDIFPGRKLCFISFVAVYYDDGTSPKIF